MIDSKKPLPEAQPLEFQLLLVCARTRLNGTLAAQLSTLAAAEPDWETVLRGARHHGVMPLLHRHLSSLGMPLVPGSVLAELGNYARQNAVHNLVLSHALLRILEAFKREGVEAVPYKGPALASGAYGDIALRSFKDLDLIVQPQNFDLAATTLQRLGYEISTRNPDGHFHESFVQAETGILVELHHDVIKRRYSPIPLELSALWRDLMRSTLLGQPVATFRPEDMLLLLCLHGSNHAWQGLIWICDVSEFLSAHPQLDWKLVLQKAAQAGISTIVLLGLGLAHRLLEAPLPEGVRQVLESDPKLSKLTRQVTIRMCERRGPLREAVLTYQLQLAMRPARLKVPFFLKFITFILHPNAQDRAAAQLPTRWRFGYYLVRPLRLIRRNLLPN